WDLTPNAISRAVEARRASGQEILDLTEANPTAVGLGPPPAELAAALGEGADRYRPEPLGLPEARLAVARHHRVEAGDVVLCASTSEAYAWLFKLLCDPGDRVLVPRPGYPLFE